MIAARKKMAQKPTLRQTSSAASTCSARLRSQPDHRIEPDQTASSVLNSPKSTLVRKIQISPATTPGTSAGK